MNTIMKKTFCIALCIAVAMAFSVALPGAQAAAKSKKLKMPTKEVNYELTGGKWVKSNTLTYKFNKSGDLTRLTNSEAAGDPTTYKYKYKKKKKVSGTSKSKYRDATYKFNKKGQLTYEKTIDKEENNCYSTRTLKYNKGGYLTAIDWTNTNGEYVRHKGTYKYTTTYGAGGIVTTKVTGIDFDDRNVSITCTYNKQGLMTKKDNNGDVSTYTYKMKGKYVVERYETKVWDYDGRVSKYKTVFTTGKKKAAASKYYKYINKDPRTVIGTL